MTPCLPSSLDVTLIKKNLSNRLLHIGCGNLHRIMLCGIRIADSCEHIGDGISNLHTVEPPFAIALLPAGLLDAGDLTGMSQLSEADAAYSVFAKIGVRSAADLTSVVSP